MIQGLHHNYLPGFVKLSVVGMDFLIESNPDGVNIHNIHDAVNNDVLKERLNYIISKTQSTGIRTMAFPRSLEAAKISIRAGVKFLIYSIERKTYSHGKEENDTKI